jgi:hypothetical protein
MKRDKLIGCRIGLPSMFYQELEGIYTDVSGAHEALSFADYLSMLLGLGLKEYRKTLSQLRPESEKMPAAPEADPWDFDGAAPPLRRVGAW